MSISPQSLAKTRDKRSLRMPSRFNDFREIPTEVAYRDVAEALNIKGKDKAIQIKDILESEKTAPKIRTSSRSCLKKKSSSKKSASRSRKSRVKTSLEDGGPSSVVGDQSSSCSSTVSNSSCNSCKDNSKNSTPGVNDILECNERTTEEPKTRRSSDSTESLVIDTSIPDISLVKSSQETLDSMNGSSYEKCVEDNRSTLKTSPSQPILSKQTPAQQFNQKPKIADYSRNKTEIVAEALQDDNFSPEVKDTTVERLDLFINNLTTQSSKSKTIRDSDDQVSSETNEQQDDVIRFWKGTFHPSVMIRTQKQHQTLQSDTKSETKTSVTAQSPLIECKPNSPIVSTSLTPGATARVGLQASSRKKPKGFSLMAKPNQTPASQPPPTPPVNNQKNAQQHQIVYSQAKQMSNITTQPNMHYGTRLLLNEPIYLPRSVGTIAPITATLQQIAAQARKPPFLTRKFESCMNFQNSLKFNQMVMTHHVLIKIVSELGYSDRMRLRCVNKVWKSIVDSDSVWSRVIFDKSDSGVDLDRCADFLKNRRVKEITFNQFGPIPIDSLRNLHQQKGSGFRPLTAISDVFERFFDQMTDLRQVNLKSAHPVQNIVALKIAHGAVRCRQTSTSIVKKIRPTCELSWFAKVGIDPCGVANITMARDIYNYDYSVASWDANYHVIRDCYDVERGLCREVTDNFKFGNPVIKPI